MVLFSNETILTYEDLLKDKMDEESIRDKRKQIANGEINEVTATLGPAPAFSYDMY